MLPFSFAPHDLVLIAFVSPALFLYAIHEANVRHAFFSGWFYGLGVFGVGVWWLQVSIHQFGIPHWVFSITLTAAFISFVALYFAIFAIFARLIKRENFWYVFVIPALWMLMEYFRSNLFTGFPWLLIGYTQIDGPFKGWMPIVGSLGSTAFVVFVSAIFVWILRPTNRRLCLALMLLVSLFFSCHILQDIEWTQKEHTDLDVALVQGSIEQRVKWENDQWLESIQQYLDLSKPYWGTDVIVWPETAVTVIPDRVPGLVAKLRHLADSEDTSLLIGIPTLDRFSGTYRNSVLKLGDGTELYSKRKLVPFGEYFPFKERLSWINNLLLVPMSDLSSGMMADDSFVLKGYQAGILICYEVAFKEIAFSSLPEAGFLVNVSNDAWFGDTKAPFQHLQIVKARALESGRSIVRATNTGITAFIDYRGQVVKRAPQFSSVVLKHTVSIRSGITPYVRYGDFPLLFFSVLVISIYGIFVFLSFRKSIHLNDK